MPVGDAAILPTGTTVAEHLAYTTMTLDTYMDEWQRDAVISPDELDADARNVPLLHARWWRRYISERLRFKKLELDYKTLYHQKYEWYSGKMLDEDRIKLGWEPNPKLIRLREDIIRHIDADRDIQKLVGQRALVEETLRFLEDVIKSINKRGYDIKNAIDFLRFKSGV